MTVNPAGAGGTDGGTGTPASSVGDDEILTMPKSKFSAEVARIAAREKEQGGRQAVTELGRKLGVESVDDLEKIVTAYRSQQEREMSETERARAEAQKLLEQAQKDRAEAAAAKLEARATAALAKAHAIDPDLLVQDLAKAGVTADSTDTEIAAAVEQLKTQRPAQFARPGTPGGVGDPGVPPAGSPHGGNSGSVERGALAKQMLERRSNRTKGGAGRR